MKEASYDDTFFHTYYLKFCVWAIFKFQHGGVNWISIQNGGGTILNNLEQP